MTNGGRIREAAKFALGLVLIAAIGIGAFFAIRGTWRAFEQLEKEVSTAIIAGVVTILVSVISVVGVRYYERRQQIEQQQREKKIPMYEEFIDFWMGMMNNGPSRRTPSQDELQEFFVDFTKKLLVWGSDDVVREWVAFRSKFTGGEAPDGTETLLSFERVLFSLRREFGHRNKNVKQGQLLGLFVNDIQQHIGARR